MINSLRASLRDRALLWLLFVCALVRATLWLVYGPQFGHDTFDFQTIALQLGHFNVSLYQGERVPGYSFWLLLCGMNYSIVVMAQNILGLAATILLFDLGMRLTQNRWVALLAGGLHGLALNQISSEFWLLTETLSAFLVVLSYWLFVAIRRKGATWGSLLALGAVASCGALTRPNLAFLVPLYFFVLLAPIFLKSKRAMSQAIAGALVYALPVVLLVGGWCWFNRMVAGHFTLTIQTGFNLIQHGSTFLDLAPDKYSVVRDIMLTYAHHHSANPRGDIRFVSFEACPEIQARTGMTYANVSSELARMSVDLYVRHPIRYLRGVCLAWLAYWTAGSCWNTEVMGPVIYSLIRWLSKIQRIGFICMNGCFVFICLAMAHRRVRGSVPFDQGVLIMLVFAASLIQALTQAGENSRFAIPFQSLTFLVVLSFAGSFWGILRRRWEQALP